MRRSFRRMPTTRLPRPSARDAVRGGVRRRPAFFAVRQTNTDARRQTPADEIDSSFTEHAGVARAPIANYRVISSGSSRPIHGLFARLDGNENNPIEIAAILCDNKTRVAVPKLPLFSSRDVESQV